MKKPRIGILPLLTAVFAAFTLGLFLGRNQTQSSVILSVPAVMHTMPQETHAIEESVSPNNTGLLNINTAGMEEFMTLPGIGEVLAERIVAYRDANGSFSSVEGLMYVEGIGEKKMEGIWDFITIGG